MLGSSSLDTLVPFNLSPNNNTCTIAYTLTYSNGTSIDPNIFTFNATTPPSLAIYSTNTYYLGNNYTFKLTGTISFNTGSPQSTSATFTVFVQENQCITAAVTQTSTIGTLYYDMSSGEVDNYNLNWWYTLNSTCSIAYSILV